ncbi:PQQ-binding-like beta-propeller repeat protein [Candidatus Poribacteria bacterium]|nr:PQQ-binding-like beta-propeller repeat protein [Candidatus Poribacteria bacterium]
MISVHIVQAMEIEVQAPDLRTRQSGSDWDRFLGPTGDSKSFETDLLTSWSSEGPPVVWEKEIGTSYGAPTVSQGRLFMFDRHSGLARLTCMKSETGDELWRFEYPTDYEDLYGYNNGPRTCPVVDGNRVYIFGPEGMLHCVVVSDGKLLWSVDATAKFHIVQNFFGVGSAPVVEGELLIVQIGGSPPGRARTLLDTRDPIQGDGSGIVAFNKLTGEVVYQITDELASYTTPTLATINGRRWCFTFARGGLVGFEPRTGTVDFHYPWRAKKFESVNASNPVVVDDLVFISETYGLGSSLLKVRPGGYDVVWKDFERRRNKAMQLHWNTAIHHEGYLYGYSGRHSTGCELRCIELRTGKAVWSHRVDERGSLLYADGHFVSLGEFGTLMLIRPTPEKFDLVSKVELIDEHGDERIRYPAWAAPVLSNGFLYLRGKDRLVCLDLMLQDK